MLAKLPVILATDKLFLEAEVPDVAPILAFLLVDYNPGDDFLFLFRSS